MRIKNQKTEFGGYFGLDLPDFGDPFPTLFKVQSGRAALRLVVESAGFAKVHIPAYVCDSVIDAIQDSGAQVVFYSLDENLSPLINFTVKDGEGFLYVNYFGLSDSKLAGVLAHVDERQVIIDNSQALFSPYNNGLAAIYSLRKFLGVPDGALVASDGLQLAVSGTDEGSIDRLRHMLLRTAYSAQAGYADFQKAEKSLGITIPLRMSKLTRKILKSLDIQRAKEIRKKNFASIHKRFRRLNLFPIEHVNAAALCYPLLLPMNVENLRDDLAQEGIYIPTYWQDAVNRVNDREKRFITNLLAIPCDQRYGETEVLKMLSSIQSKIAQYV